MKIIKDQQQQIRSLSEKLANELSELSFFDTTQVADKIETVFKIGLSDIFKEKAIGISKEYNRLKSELSNPKNTGWQIQKIQNEINSLKTELAEVNNVSYGLKKITEHECMRAFIRNKFGDDVIKEFENEFPKYLKQLRENAYNKKTVKVA